MQKSKTNIIIVATIVALLLFASPASAALEEFLKKVEEGGNAKLRAYDDGFGNWTIGFGSTYNWDKGRAVVQGDTITIDQAYKFMRVEIAQVLDDIKSFVKVPVSENQLFALASLGYNIGTPALKKSTLIKQLNAGYSKEDVVERFLDFVLATNKRTGRKEFSKGLENRRKLEIQLFLS